MYEVEFEDYYEESLDQLLYLKDQLDFYDLLEEDCITDCYDET